MLIKLLTFSYFCCFYLFYVRGRSNHVQPTGAWPDPLPVIVSLILMPKALAYSWS